MANKERNTTDDGDGNNAPDSVINHPPHLPLTILTTVLYPALTTVVVTVDIF